MWSYLSVLVERLITKCEILMNLAGILTNSKILLHLLLKRLVHPVSQGILLTVSPMLQIVLPLLSHLVRKRSFKKKTPLAQ